MKENRTRGGGKEPKTCAGANNRAVKQTLAPFTPGGVGVPSRWGRAGLQRRHGTDRSQVLNPPPLTAGVSPGPRGGGRDHLGRLAQRRLSPLAARIAEIPAPLASIGGGRIQVGPGLISELTRFTTLEEFRSEGGGVRVRLLVNYNKSPRGASSRTSLIF